MNSTQQKYWRSSLGTDPPYVVGVLNVTPDSFSDGGTFLTVDEAISHAKALRSAGADIIEVGGESTRPGSKAISEKEEMARVLPIVEALAPTMFISVDSYKSQTAEACLKVGAKMVNDISAFRADPKMGEVISKHGASVVLMYSKETGSSPHVSESKKDYKDVVKEIVEFLLQRIDLCVKCAIDPDKIIIDTGMGRFLSHDPKYSWEVLQRYEEFKLIAEKAPLLIATSRKGFLGGDLKDRDTVSQLTALIACERGASFIRTHNVMMAREFLNLEAAVESSRGGGDG